MHKQGCALRNLCLFFSHHFLVLIVLTDNSWNSNFLILGKLLEPSYLLVRKFFIHFI